MTTKRLLRQVLLLTSKTADDRKTLAAVRGLAGSGVKVTLASDKPGCAARYSNYCHRFVLMPDVASPAEEWAHFMLAHLDDDRPDAVLPLCDYTTRALAGLQSVSTGIFNTCLPSLDQLVRASDKALLMEFAARLGIATPRTISLGSPGAIDQVERELGYPCVVKLRRGAGGAGLTFPASRDELARVLKANNRPDDNVFASESLAQEFIPGEVHDACVLFRNGEPRAALTQRRLLMQPRSGGAGVYNETTQDPELLEQAFLLMRALQWHGPAQVEFKRDTRTGRPVLMEINPRFWGTLDIAIRAGINFPLLTAEIASLGDTKPVYTYQHGLRMRWLFHYQSAEKPAAGFEWRALLDALPGRQKQCSDFWWTDPRPHLASLYRPP